MIRKFRRNAVSAAAALLISTFFITAAVGPAVSPATAADAQRSVA